MNNDRCSQCPLILVVAGVAVLAICLLAQFGFIPSGGGKTQAASFYAGIAFLGAGIVMWWVERRLGPQ